jgi:hypothetical protein
LSDLQYLMHQLGPATPEIATIVQESIDCWMLEFDEGVSLQIAWDERSNRVLMKCALGQPDETTCEALYASLLHANLQLTSIADVKLALSDSDDDVMLIGQYEIGEDSVDVLREKLSEFLNLAGKFSLWVAGTSTPESGSQTPPIASMQYAPA